MLSCLLAYGNSFANSDLDYKYYSNLIYNLLCAIPNLLTFMGEWRVAEVPNNRLRDAYLLKSIHFQINVCTIFSWLNFMVIQLIFRLTSAEWPSNWVNWRCAKQWFKNEWTLPAKETSCNLNYNKVHTTSADHQKFFQTMNISFVLACTKY